ncbi:MAG TPA: cytochrome P450 [Sporichthyaceae bacterium]
MADCPYTPADLTRLLSGDPALTRCPFPLYDVLRAEAPVVHNERLNAFVVSRYAEVVGVLRDPVTYSSAMASGPSSVTGLAKEIIADPDSPAVLRGQAERRLRIAQSPVLLFTDPPLHKRQRTLVSAAFSAKRVKQLEPEVRRLTGELIDTFIADGTVDLVTQFSIQLPMTVIAVLLGVPPSEMAMFKRWSNAFTAGVGAVEQTEDQIATIFAEVDTFYSYFTEQIERRRHTPQDDLLTDLVAARLDGEAPLALDEILQMLVQFLVAGNETTTNAITTLMYYLARDPALAARVRDNAALVDPLVEEMLRVEAPVQGMFRVSTADSTVGGVPVPAGSLLWLVYGSANRDPDAFADAGAIDLDADRAAHLTFARFEHFCLGASIARLELRVAAELLLARLDDIQLACPDDELTYHRSFVLRGLAGLPLSFTARS